MYLHVAWKRYPLRPEPPRIGYYREYPLGGEARKINGWAVDTTASPFLCKMLYFLKEFWVK